MAELGLCSDRKRRRMKNSGIASRLVHGTNETCNTNVEPASRRIKQRNLEGALNAYVLIPRASNESYRYYGSLFFCLRLYHCVREEQEPHMQVILFKQFDSTLCRLFLFTGTGSAVLVKIILPTSSLDRSNAKFKFRPFPHSLENE